LTHNLWRDRLPPCFGDRSQRYLSRPPFVPAMKLEIPHELSQEEAAPRVRSWFEGLLEDHRGRLEAADVRWVESNAEFVFRVRGISISGSLSIEPSAVRIEAKVPFLVAGFRSKIEDAIVSSLGRELAV